MCASAGKISSNHQTHPGLAPTARSVPALLHLTFDGHISWGCEGPHMPCLCPTFHPRLALRKLLYSPHQALSQFPPRRDEFMNLAFEPGPAERPVSMKLHQGSTTRQLCAVYRGSKCRRVKFPPLPRCTLKREPHLAPTYRPKMQCWGCPPGEG